MKRHTSVDELMAGWHSELDAAGWPIERLAAHLEHVRQKAPQLRFGLTDADIDQLAAEVLDIDGNLLAGTRCSLAPTSSPK